ncbi:hypothetical protein MNV49_002430 [Pseudohyphozyma bogoriensis]|nr:hypothetical protein MNV49_002430 [Pseudohyphozyma bogoriensis]
MDRDVVSVTALQLRTPSLPADLWARTLKPQPLVVSFSIKTSITEEASSDSLLASSLNYSSVTKAVEAAVAALDPSVELSFEELAEHVAKVIVLVAGAPNVDLYLEAPRALLSAESVGVRIYRDKHDYVLAPHLASSANSAPATDLDQYYSLAPTSTNTPNDRFVVKALRKSIIIGVNPCERLDEQEVIVDLEFGAPEEMQPFVGGLRAGWKDWRKTVKLVESHLSTSKPLTIESITTSVAQTILTPPLTPFNSFSTSSTTVRISKPVALMFARYPSVQVTRSRSDFFLPSGQPRPQQPQSRTLATSSVASSRPGEPPMWDGSETGSESTAATEDVGNGGAGRTHTAYLAVGTNMGDRVGNISRALKELEEQSVGGDKTKVVETSFLYESEPMYVTDQAPFLNGAIKIETTLAPLPLLEHLKSIEDSLGRLKTIRNGPRVIDLDILLYDDLAAERIGEGERWLTIPHASIAEREFVLRPLADIAPTLPHPVLTSTPTELLSTLLSTTPTSLHRVLPLSSSLAHPIGSRTLFMTILNATPDSFSDGGDNFALSSALVNAKAHISAGADILDIGGMSTRPGAADVTEEEEIARVVPLIRAIRENGITAPISIDTFRPAVARAAIEAGADIINDVLGGSHEGMLEVMADLDVPVVLMHSRGMPQTMGRMTEYPEGVVEGVRKELGERVQKALEAGVKRWNIVLDPGVGFAKTGEQNVKLLKELPSSLGRLSSPPSSTSSNIDFLALFPSLVGLSRKKFIGTITGKEEAKERVWGTTAGVVASIAGGTDIVRVHDLEMIDVVKVADKIYRKYWTDLAQLLERGKFNALFVADVLGAYDVYGGSTDAAVESGAQFGVSDPSLFVSAAAARTQNLSFGITQSLTYERPFTVARRFATLDHLTSGRIGINLVTSYLTSAAKLHGLEEQIEHDERYKRADEYTDVLYKLWESSWQDGAVVLDKQRKVYAEPSSVREIHHDGEYYKLHGAALVEPSPQRTPVIFQAGGSPAGLNFAAKHAEAVFFGGYSVSKIRASADRLRTLLTKYGRDPYAVKIILGATIIVAETDEAARAKEADLRSTASELGAKVLLGGWIGVDLAPYKDTDDLREIGPPALKGIIEALALENPDVKVWTADAIANITKIGGRVGPTIVGSVKTVADRLTQFVEEGDVDGFNLSYATTPGTFEDIVNLLVPELQRRGVHWLDYPEKTDGKGITAREGLFGIGQSRLRDDHYAHKFKWAAGHPAPNV